MRFWVFLLIVLTGVSIAACKTTRVLKEIHADLPEVIQFNNDRKVVQFISLHHIGKPVYYNNVRDLVKELKKDGYVVYYEFVNEEADRDSLSIDIYKRKFRKLVGFQLDSGGYASALHSRGLLLHLINQPAYSFFGVDSSDLRVDVSTAMLVDAYENKYGVIELDQTDKAQSLEGSSFAGSNRPPREKVMSILIDYRNQNLARFIQSSRHSRIIVMYGADHVDGTFVSLSEMDAGWKRN